MKRTHLASFSSKNKTQEDQEGDTSGNDRVIMNLYNSYEAGLIPWPPKNYTCSFCRRDFRSAQALGGHMNVHRRDRAKLRQIPSWLFEPHQQHVPVGNPNPNFGSSSPLTMPAHLDPSLTNQISKTSTFSSDRFDFLDNTSHGGLMKEREKNKSNVCSRELKKSAIDSSCHAAKCEISRGEMNKKHGFTRLELGMDLRNPNQVLDLELRLGCL
ncbi:BnaA04g24460D [Brassica napus]|uniref:BnaA04g24460D protein n=4 Tax=Brassica TaxID=3705 RepID=A0A078IFM2_BRANA|nr:zinc finger protein 11-like [Brassica napus]CDY47968.1 BnaA04g24460D [Brassica napus]VDD15882.1 unnamed protein product [Brassica rapa]